MVVPKLIVVDYGSQYTFLLARRLRSPAGGGVLCEIISPEQLEDYNSSNCSGIVLSGGPQTVSTLSDEERRVIFDPDIPVLGICYGMQLLGKAFGGKVHPAVNGGEYGQMEICVMNPTDEILGGVVTNRVWMSHGDEVSLTDELMKNVHISAISATHGISAIRSKECQCWGLQFHPEVQHTENGCQMLYNFVTRCCKLQPNTWSDDEQLTKCTRYIVETVDQDDRIILGLSGGVDSAVVAALLARVLPRNQWLAVYIDHGMMRAGESDAVKDYAKQQDLPFKYLDCSKQFLSALEGVIDPEQKRKIIGRLFVEAFQSATDAFKPTMLAQGTIYPDVVESAKSSANQHLIKSHHNVGGLPENLGLSLLEPLKLLFKDEVRAIGAKLKLPETIVNRPPFPGPGLGIRIVGQSVTAAKVSIVQRADKIFHDCLKVHHTSANTLPSQSYAALLPGLSVGVVGDQRRHGMIICLRAVRTDDFMTASLCDFPMDFLQSVASRIVNECSEVARVVFDITSKPPGTIELE